MPGIRTKLTHRFGNQTNQNLEQPISLQIIDDCNQAIKKITTNTSNEFQETLTKFLTDFDNKFLKNAKNLQQN